ncbi:YitT family protein [Streptococcus loxodontisalivarius]|uniref:Uncharacterized membrane-anchored protein YitT (DUF2179 family) n=1 Tax=Streptococcus loxodontisalivarius TaxID=1349415 RepID=A0ABS2PPL7_9STRE|nr:YitT family protein [Streptococcus loxodontisalivarius]MBM7641888.1 uncharacterized membrane-anchored protein YitT (DUF2179 family) [Streptococcus loxodontisalivarius]
MTKLLWNLLLVSLGSICAAIGFNSMFLHNHIASGGMVGLSVSFQELFDWNPSTFLLFTNIPLLLLCLIFLGKDTFLKTLFGSWFYPIAIKLTAGLPNLTENPLLAALFGGVIVGFGLGLVFWGNSSTGGTGIITQIIHKYSPLSLSLAMAITDGFSVAMGFVAFDVDTVMYSIIALGVISYTVYLMEVGPSSARNMMIISPQNQAIQSYISSQLDRGVSRIPIQGGYTGQEKTMLMTTISSREVYHFEKAILEIDPIAFIVITPASHVRGRGFSLTKHYELAEQDLILPM